MGQKHRKHDPDRTGASLMMRWPRTQAFADGNVVLVSLRSLCVRGGWATRCCHVVCRRCFDSMPDVPGGAACLSGGGRTKTTPLAEADRLPSNSESASIAEAISTIRPEGLFRKSIVLTVKFSCAYAAGNRIKRHTCLHAGANCWITCPRAVIIAMPMEVGMPRWGIRATMPGENCQSKESPDDAWRADAGGRDDGQRSQRCCGSGYQNGE